MELPDRNGYWRESVTGSARRWILPAVPVAVFPVVSFSRLQNGNPAFGYPTTMENKQGKQARR
jgi:hypothetical protein